MGFSPNWMKGIAMAVMIVVAVVGAIALPLFLKHKSMNCVFGQSMAAGILIMAALTHLLPEAADQMEHSLKEKAGVYAGVICTATVFILILIEEIASYLWLAKESNEAPPITAEPLKELESGDAEHELHTAVRTAEAPSSLAIPNAISTPGAPTSDKNVALHFHCHGDGLSDVTTTAKLSVSAVCLFGALSFHSIVEGFSLGASTDMKSTMTILVSIACHKGLAGFALGQTLLQANYEKLAFAVMTTVFVLFSPIGLAIGWGFNFNGSGAGVGATTAIAAGTFLSISTYELLPQVFRKPGRLAEKATGLLLGAGLLAIALIWLDGAHNHGTHHGHGHHEHAGHHGHADHHEHDDHHEHSGAEHEEHHHRRVLFPFYF